MTKKIKQTTKHIPFILLAASLLVAVTMAVKVFAYTTSSRTIPVKIANALDAANGKAEEAAKYTTSYKDIASDLKKKSVFAPPPAKKKNPVKNVDGILGSSALINGKFYKVGDKIGEAELVAIEPTFITVKFEGKESKLVPIGKATKYEAPKKKAKKGKKTDDSAEAQAVVKEEVVEEVESASEEDPLAWIGVKLSAALRAKFLEKWNSMTDEQKAQAKEQWGKMPQEQKEKMVGQMEQNIDKI